MDWQFVYDSVVYACGEGWNNFEEWKKVEKFEQWLDEQGINYEKKEHY